MFNICYVWDYVPADRAEASNVYIRAKFHDLGVLMWGTHSGGTIVRPHAKILHKRGAGQCSR